MEVDRYNAAENLWCVLNEMCRDWGLMEVTPYAFGLDANAEYTPDVLNILTRLGRT